MVRRLKDFQGENCEFGMKTIYSLIVSLFLVGCAAPKHSGWLTIDAGPFTFCLPVEFQKTAMQGIDSFVAEYKSVGLSVVYDYGAYFGDSLAPLAEEKSVAVATERIGGRDVELIWYKINPFDEQDRNYRVVAGFRNTSLVMSATSETLDGCETAKEIFRTVRFKQP